MTESINEEQMDQISLSEFMHLARLTPAELVQMLEQGELPVAQGPLGELLIDLTEFDVASIAHRKPKTSSASPGETVLVEELVATEVVQSLDSMVDEALALAMGWRDGESG